MKEALHSKEHRSHYIVVDADALKSSLAEHLSNSCKRPGTNSVHAGHIPWILYFFKNYFELKKLHIFLGLEEPDKSTINNGLNHNDWLMW